MAASSLQASAMVGGSSKRRNRSEATQMGARATSSSSMRGRFGAERPTMVRQWQRGVARVWNLQ
jgi:hypothetical protein